MKPQYLQWQYVHTVCYYSFLWMLKYENRKLKGILIFATFGGSKRVEGILYPICDLDVVVFQRMLLICKENLEICTF